MKVWYYIVGMLGIILLLQFAGVKTAAEPIFTLTGVNFNEDKTLNETTTSASGFYNELFGLEGEGTTGLLIALAASLGALVVGFLTKSSTENLILLPLITGSLVLFIQTMVGILNTVIATGDTWIAAIMGLILIPFTIGYIIALAEFFRGTD
jgi:hypothetical protein